MRLGWPVGSRVPERDHVPEFPLRVDMEQRKGRLGREESLTGEVEQRARILPDGIQQHRLGELRRDLAQDVDRLGFQVPQVRRKLCRHGPLPHRAGKLGHNHGKN